MPTAVVDLDQSHAVQIQSNTESVRRTAFYLDSQGQPLFAWLHHRVEQTGFDHGVIICPPIGYEQLHSHRSLRHLADTLAHGEIPVLRFDWHGTGDSAGVDEDAGRVATWLANVRDAVQWMRERFGCRQVSLVGLRIGGSLAALAAADVEIDNLVLWAPVTKGRTYVREMKAISLMAETASRIAPDADGHIEAAGFVLSSETAADLSQIDLLQCRPDCRRVLLVSRDDLPDDTRLSDHLSEAGVSVEKIAAPGFTEMMVEPHRSLVPETAIREITRWLTQKISAEASPTPVIDISYATPTETLMPSATSPPHNKGDQHFRESAVRISTQPDLFGIVCEPVDSVANDLPWVVLLNAGSSYRIGPGRLYVFLARQLAMQGFRTVRLDFCSLGDSISPDSKSENDPHPATAFRDVELVLKNLQHRFDAKKIVLMGLCSGAYAAFQSAAQIQNPVLVESVLINPLTFFWREGMSLDVSPVRQLLSIHYYIGAAMDPTKWLKLLSGRSKIGVVGAIKIVLRKLRVLRLPKSATRNDSIDGTHAVGPGHPREEDVPGDLDRIVRSGRTLAMFFATTDPGYSILTFYARRKVKQLRQSGRLNVSFIADADHTFSTRAARQKLSRSISDYLCRRYRKLD
ncbi:MAG: alpha/beta fold hydrolase [Planctomycetota bacterium]